MSHREFLAREAWARRELNRPSRTDRYLVQIAHEVHELGRAWRKQPTTKAADFILEFDLHAKQPTEEDRRKHHIFHEKSSWAARGAKIKDGR